MTQRQAPYNALSERIMEITGHTADLSEALDEFENLKEAVAELHDENQALAIINRRLRLCLDLAWTNVVAINAEAGMFVTEKTRGKTEQFFEQYAKLDAAKVQSKGIVEKEK